MVARRAVKECCSCRCCCRGCTRIRGYSTTGTTASVGGILHSNCWNFYVHLLCYENGSRLDTTMIIPNPHHRSKLTTKSSKNCFPVTTEKVSFDFTVTRTWIGRSKLLVSISWFTLLWTVNPCPVHCIKSGGKGQNNSSIFRPSIIFWIIFFLIPRLS